MYAVGRRQLKWRVSIKEFNVAGGSPVSHRWVANTRKLCGNQAFVFYFNCVPAKRGQFHPWCDRKLALKWQENMHPSSLM